MKLIYIFALAFLAATQAVNDDKWQVKSSEEVKQVRFQCLSEHPLTAEQLTQIKNFNFPDEEPVRKFCLCVVLKLDIFCTQNGYHIDRLVKQLALEMPEAEVRAIAKTCVDKNEQGSPIDVWAFRGHQCLMKSAIGEAIKTSFKQRHANNNNN